MKENEYKNPSCPDCDYPHEDNEISSDFIVETEPYNTDEFTELPNEFAVDNDIPSDNNSDCSNCAGHSHDDVYDNYDVESADDTDSEAMQYVIDPSDETAATTDEWYDSCDTPAQERCKLDDYEIISDVLGSEKELVKLYGSALCETSEEPLRDIIRENFDEAAADQYKAFTYMQQRGMYNTEQATEQKITEAKQQFTPLCNNCGCGKK